MLPENHVIQSNTSPAAFKSCTVYARSLLLPNHAIDIIIIIHTLCCLKTMCISCTDFNIDHYELNRDQHL